MSPFFNEKVRSFVNMIIKYENGKTMQDLNSLILELRMSRLSSRVLIRKAKEKAKNLTFTLYV